MNKKITLMVASLLTLGLAFATGNPEKLMSQEATATDTNPTSIRVDRSVSTRAADFKVEKVFYYIIDETEGLVGVAPSTKGVLDMYQHDIVIPEKVKYAKEGQDEREYKVVAIGNSAFANCFYISSVTMPETILSIGTAAFWGTSLKQIIVPNSVKEIGDRCFKESWRLEHLRFGKNVNKIGTDLLSGCCNLKTIEVDPENKILSSEEGILYDKAKSTLIRCPSWRNDVKKVVLPSTVTKIEEGGFEYCEFLTEIELNEGLKEIESSAFYLCRQLQALKIPSTVERIADGSAFSLLAGCKKFEVDPANTHYSTLLDGRMLFQKETKTMVSLLYTTDTAPVVIPEEVEHIGEKAMILIFENNAIERDYRGKGTQQVILPQTLKSIGASAFSGTNIGSLKVPDGVEKIPDEMVEDCKNLHYVAIGKGCKEIGFDVFSGCDILANTRQGVIRCYAEIPPQMAKNNKKEVAEFEEKITQKSQLQVPEASLHKYLQAKGWKKFRDIKKLEGQANEEIINTSISIIPSEGSLTIETAEALPIYIYALDGTALFSTSDTQATVSLPRGVYLVSYQGKSYKTYVY